MSRDSEFHLLSPSPWPIFSAFGFFGVLFNTALMLHSSTAFIAGVACFLLLLISAVCFWWRDVIKEALFDNAHNYVVKNGLSIGMMLFILSEVMFFFVFFLSFFKSWLDPSNIVDNLWSLESINWPPKGLVTLNPWSIPLLNTFILLLSGTTVTWAHYSLIDGDNKSVVKALLITVFLGLTFTTLQAYEYHHADFSFKEEGVKAIYSSNFYMATGFHGAHVIIGTIFLTVCLFRAMRNRYTNENHLGFEFAAWYWHFVDVVWLLLFTFLYVLSS